MRKRNKKSISSEGILTIATQLFSRKGYRGTTIEDISKRLKVSKPALYYYFRNKIEILKSLHSRAFEELTSSSEKIINRNVPVDKKFKNFIENHVKVVAENVELVKIFFREEREFPRNVLDEMREKRKGYQRILVKLYKKGVRNELFRDIDPEMAVYLILGACNWIQMWYSRNGRLKKDKLAKLVSNFLCNGYLTRRHLKE